MPRRRWGAGWAGEAPGAACPRRIARFLEPCLLLLLRQDPNHGYNLVDALQGFGFAKDSVDASVVYRVLREMEQAGWVSSEWDTAGSGPPRRIYRLGPAGEEYLRWWIDDLRRTRDEIDRLIAAYVDREDSDDQHRLSRERSEAENGPA
jgi:PadR family transcriptional regulator, regulatory protein PadR